MPTRKRSRSRGPKPPQPETRFDRRLGEILAFATDVFYEKGYDGASMRDLSRASGMSLAGLYYYFESKEKLLYLIQKHTFSTVMELLQQQLEGVSDPEQRLRILIRNHLEYFLANLKAMKVLSHEDEALTGALAAEIADMKRAYYRICRGLVDDLKRADRITDGVPSRLAAVSLFGMMNWIYTWHSPRHDPPAGVIAEQMADTFLRGVLHAGEAKAIQVSGPNSVSVGEPNGRRAAARKGRSASLRN
jgi:AcrR family transcriptional regulator